jgi:hypothetical protein
MPNQRKRSSDFLPVDESDDKPFLKSIPTAGVKICGFFETSGKDGCDLVNIIHSTLHTY